MAANKEINDTLTNEKIIKLRNFLLQTLDSTDDKGEPDLEKIIYNATYNMGEGAIQICGLLMQENLKLEALEKEYRDIRAKVYNDTMTTRMSYSPTNEGVKTIVDGNPDVSELMSKIARQRYYIDFLKQAQEQIRYYPKNAKALVEVATYGKEIGKLI